MTAPSPTVARGYLDDQSESYDPPRTDTAATRALVEQAAMLVGGSAELARRLRVAPSHISRIRKGLVGVGVETCLNLADVLDDEPLLVLRACGYSRLSELLDFVRQGPIPRGRARLHDGLNRLSGSDRRLVGRLIDRLLLADTTETYEAASGAGSIDPPKRGVR